MIKTMMEKVQCMCFLFALNLRLFQLQGRRVILHTFLFFTPALLAGCHGNPFSASVDLITTRWATEDLREWRPKLIGQPVARADELLGPRNDTLTPNDAGDTLVIYPSPRNRKGESFFVLHLDEDERIRGVGIWKRNRDGLPDIWRVKRLLTACFSLPPEACAETARLGAPLRDLDSAATGFRAVIWDDTGFVPGSMPKLIILCFAADGLCSEVRTVGLLAGDSDLERKVTWPDPQGSPPAPISSEGGGQ